MAKVYIAGGLGAAVGACYPIYAEFPCHHAQIHHSFSFSSNLVSICFIVRSQKLTEAALTNRPTAPLPLASPHISSRTRLDVSHETLGITSMPTPMIFTDDLENIAEPNQGHAQQNLRSQTPVFLAVLTIFKESSEDDPTNKRFNFF
jgi:hypothetical protein